MQGGARQHPPPPTHAKPTVCAVFALVSRGGSQIGRCSLGNWTGVPVCWGGGVRGSVALVHDPSSLFRVPGERESTRAQPGRQARRQAVFSLCFPLSESVRSSAKGKGLGKCLLLSRKHPRLSAPEPSTFLNPQQCSRRSTQNMSEGMFAEALGILESNKLHKNTEIFKSTL